jgi:hypothetical protein
MMSVSHDDGMESLCKQLTTGFAHFLLIVGNSAIDGNDGMIVKRTIGQGRKAVFQAVRNRLKESIRRLTLSARMKGISSLIHRLAILITIQCLMIR